jgi:undecaprenyl-phosphate galactose phosphotransferase
MKKNNEKSKICILYTETSEKEFLQLSQMTDKYKVFYQFISSEETVKRILKNNEEKDTLYLTTSTDLLKKFSELRDYSEFLENKMKAIYINQKLEIPIRKKPIEDFFRRIFDIVMSIILLILSSPILILTTILVKIDIGLIECLKSPIKFLRNPSFFIQKRIGKDRKIIRVIKFRSMIIHNFDDYSKYASEEDERITWIGNVIRKTRIDEIPQIINVLKGEMSFIGPRPEWDILGYEYEKKIPNYQLHYSILPGITGWAQIQYIYGSGIEDAKVKLSYELYYLKHQSILLDLIIIMKTIKVIFLRKGM